MAVINQYERRVLPSGGVQQTQNRSGEVLGQSLQQLGQATQGAVFDIARAEKTIQQKNDSAWLGSQKPQAILDLNGKLDNLNKPKLDDGTDNPDYVDPTSNDYETKISKTIDDYMAEATKNAPSADSQAELRNYLTSLKANYLEAGGKFADQSKFAKRIGQIDESNRKWGAVIVANPGQFDAAVQAQEQLIRSQGLRPDQTEEQVRKMKANMAGYAMNGQASADPNGFLKSMGKWGEQGAEPTDIAQAQNIAQAELKRREAEQKAEAARAQAQFANNVVDRANDAISSMQVNGGVMPMVNGKPLITNDDIRKAKPDDPVWQQRMIDKLNTSQTIGLTLKQMESQTIPELKATVASMAPTPGAVFTTDQAEAYKMIAGAADDKVKALNADMLATLRDSQNEAQNAVATGMPDWLQTARSTQSIPEAAYTSIAEAGYEPSKAAALRQQLNEAVRIGGLEKQAKSENVSIKELGSIYQNLVDDAQAGGEGSSSAASTADAVRETIQAKIKAYESDPASAAVTYSPTVRSAWSDYQSAAASGDQSAAQGAFKNAVSATNADLDRNGVPSSRRDPMPKDVATTIAQGIATLPNAKAQIQALQQYTIPNDAGLTRRIMSQLVSVQGALPQGVDMVIDALDPLSNGGQGGDPVRAERMMASLTADTKGINLPDTARKRMESGLKAGIIGAVAKQADFTGNTSVATSLAASVRGTVEQAAKAKISLGMDPNAAVDEAISDFTGHYQIINDPSLGALYYPKAAEDQSAGTFEAGLEALRTDAGKKFGAAAKPTYSPDMNAVIKKFPALEAVAGNVIVENKPDPGDGRQLESFPPWESENPNPGKFTTQIFNTAAYGDERTNLIAGDMLHYIGGVDPESGRPVDPTFRTLKTRFLQSITPEQRAIDQKAFEQSKQWLAPDVTFDQWMDFSRGDEYLMGALTPDKADEWRNIYTPQQRKILSQMEAYLKTPRPAKADPYVAATARDIASGAVWVNQGEGYALIVPGSNRKLMTASLKDVQSRGLREQMAPTISPSRTSGATPADLATGVPADPLANRGQQ